MYNTLQISLVHNYSSQKLKISLQWHLGFYKYDYTPTKRGFDSFFGYWLATGSYWDHSESEPAGWGLDLRNNTEVS